MMRVPVPREFPARYAAFTAWIPHGVLGSVRLTGGPGVSRHPRTLRRIAAGHALPCLVSTHRCSMGGLRAWALSSHGARCNRASDTSVASPSSAECRNAFAFLRAFGSLEPFRFSRVRKPPRSPWPPPRERGWPDTTRDAFRRQGPFVGSGGLYSPGPATTAPLLASCDDR